MAFNFKSAISAILLTVISFCLCLEGRGQSKGSDHTAFPSITILDTIVLKSPIVRLHASPPGFAVLESNGNFTSFDSTGRAVNTIRLAEIEDMDDFTLLSDAHRLVIIRYRAENSTISGWLTKLREGSEGEYRSIVEFVDVDGTNRYPIYESHGWLLSADFDFELGLGALIVGLNGLTELDLYNIESGSLLQRMELSSQAHNVVISSSEVFVLELTKVLVYSYADDRELIKERVHYLSEPAPGAWCFESYKGGSKSLICLTDSLEMLYGPIELTLGGRCFPTIMDFWGYYLGGFDFYTHDFLALTSELFMIGNDEFAIAELNSGTFEVYPTYRLLGIRDQVRIVPLTESKCVIQLFDEDGRSNMLIMVDLSR